MLYRFHRWSTVPLAALVLVSPTGLSYAATDSTPADVVLLLFDDCCPSEAVTQLNMSAREECGLADPLLVQNQPLATWRTPSRAQHRWRDSSTTAQCENPERSGIPVGSASRQEATDFTQSPCAQARDYELVGDAQSAEVYSRECLRRQNQRLKSLADLSAAGASPDELVCLSTDPELLNSQQAADLGTVCILAARHRAIEGDREGAVQLLVEAAQLRPTDSRVYLMLYTNYNALGDRAAADLMLQRYYELSPPVSMPDNVLLWPE